MYAIMKKRENIYIVNHAHGHGHVGGVVGVHQQVAGGCIWHGHVGHIKMWVGLAWLGYGHKHVGALCCVQVGKWVHWPIGVLV